MSEEERYIIEEKENEVTEEVGNKTFPVKSQLFVLGVMLFLLFGSLIIPKTVSFLQGSEITDDSEFRVLKQEANLNNVNVSSEKIDSMDIRAKSAFVWDVSQQRAIFQKNPDKILPLASITKLMTALVAYELVTDDTSVIVSTNAAAQQSGGSLRSGERFEIKDLADFALISSYNSAAYTVADSVGAILGDNDPVGQFVAGMNIRASELELNSMKFLNPTGLDISADEAGAFGSAKDVSLLVEHIIQNHPEILTPTILQSKRIFNKNGEYHDAHNTNNIVLDIPNLMGSKTGFTDLAGGNLVVAFDAGFNRPIVVAVLGSTRAERFTDVQKIISEVQSTIVGSKE